MKKITAFFMALFPFLVIGILFATGLIAKNFSDKTVQRLEIKETSYELQKDKDAVEPTKDLSDEVVVIPAAARDPSVYWLSSDETIASVDKETGIVHGKGYGDVKLTAIAKSNESAKAYCNLKVWDNKIHKIEVINKEQAAFMSAGSSLQLQVKTIPSERIVDPSLRFVIADPEGHKEFSVTQTGLVTASAAANGSATVQIINDASGVSASVTVTVQTSLDKVGFANDGDTLTQETSYNLYDEVQTAPYKEKLDPEKYFKFESSDPVNAPIDTKGNISFTANYFPGTFVEFTVKFAGLDSISATKRVASSLDYYGNVAFEKYEYTEKLDLTSPKDLTDIKYSTYPAKGNINRLHFLSSDPDVVDWNDEKKCYVAYKPGRATLTIKADVTETSSIIDKVDVIILSDKSQEIFDEHQITIDSYYYPLRKELNSLFTNKKITWAIEATDASLTDKETIIFTKTNTTAKVKATCDGVSDTLTITCNAPTNNKVVDISSGTAYIAAGELVQFANGETPITLPETPSILKRIGTTNTYIAMCGSLEIKVKVDDTTSFNLGVSEPVISFTSDKDWTHITTNEKVVDVGSAFKMYPTTATYTTTNIWGEITGVYTPEISYKYTADDESVITVSEDNKVTFEKPTTMYVDLTCEEVTKTFSVTSYANKGGKFSLKNAKDSSVMQSGCSVTIAPGDTFDCYVDEFYVNPVDVEKVKNEFKITATSNDDQLQDKILTNLKVETSGGKLHFKFDGKSAGKDVIEISNGYFNFYINVEVTMTIQNIDLYCLGNLLKKTDGTYKINAYTLDNLILNMDFDPVVARNESINLTFNSYSWTQTVGQQIKLSTNLDEKIVWNETGDNTLTITYKGKELAKYIFVKATSAPENFSIVDTHTEGDKSCYYLPAKKQYATMRINIPDAIFSQEYFKNNFIVDGVSKSDKIFAQYVIGQVANPGETKDIKIGVGSKTNTYTLKRDSVSKIVLPKHNNDDPEDQKGLQKVTVYGNKTYPKATEKTPSPALIDTYELPVTLYDANDNEIKDLTAKTTAMNSLSYSFLTSAAKSKYNPQSGNIDITFDSSADWLYTWSEIFDNEFAKLNKNKNQIFVIDTMYGKYHPLEQSLASYSFVVVNAVNVYDQNGMVQLQKLPLKQRNMVLRVNFGIEGTKEVEKFDLLDFSFYEVYGNGYTICFDAKAKQYKKQNGAHIQHAANIDLMGCRDETFPTLTDRCIMMDTDGGENNDSNTFIYCKFRNFFQALTSWCWQQATPKSFTHVKNCMFYNEQEYCRVGMSISDPGNITVVEDCAFFNAAKVPTLCQKNATLRLKGNIDVYNFHGSDLFDCFEMGHEVSEFCWSVVKPILEANNIIQSTEYGAPKEVINSYLITLAGGKVQFYNGKDASGQDTYIDAIHGSELAANYLKLSGDVLGICQLWSTTRPPLPLEFGHSPAYSDEFVNGGEHLNYEVRNLLMQKISRWIY